ncbi:uncharacterized protein [Physcomitrium patens]|nr:uncharacterized protein LOC112277577 isoform X1 [Physcomitrium patens]XP_024365845.1 uncharacterized protein LOC112277577 isoform X1 [Physcomitrium patens]XP_024365846.1 uncharacterized protein LOC112277577 isoform X1 [Physcomitrium patens]XP_024365847.1 uncharacterized protein LOC112277577 isoform X1 [Physcomitrium patens]XP_024365848.1 uncharacterized protein LOC112277577 isoform X1 [Physcomitrium patens]XP_024365849.1 uncharacterized protein LOC112277577 isoform X1 [Physcomitrium patens]|eukprot:XP_024365844.1 uncharacterized protein LOC112277577 isoform X1 [Physcomitrella patens]
MWWDYLMAAAESHAICQRAAEKRAVQEDTAKAPKLAHRPSLKAQDSYSSFGNSCGSMDTKVDLPRQISSSAHRDYRSEYLGVEDVLLSQFKPRLQDIVAERSCTKLGISAGYIGVPSEYSVSNEVDLGWQFVLDPKPKLVDVSETKMRDKNLEGDDISPPLVEEGGEGVPTDDDEANNLSLVAHVMLPKTVQEFTSQPSTSSFESEERPEKLENMWIRRIEEAEDLILTGQSTKCLPTPISASTNTRSPNAGSSWRTSDKEALAVFVAQKSLEMVENCDLPTPRSGFKFKASLDGWEVLEEGPHDISKSLDRDLLSSVFQGGKLSYPEDLGMQASSRMYSKSESHATPFLLATGEHLNISNAPAQELISKNYSADNRNTSCSGGGGVVGSSSSKHTCPLVEALCHSQTRAREAELKVEQTKREYRKLSQLFFREASLSLTYRHWIASLQAENAWLKVCVQNRHGAVWVKHFTSTSAGLDHLSENSRKHFEKGSIHRQMLKYFSTVLRCRDPSAPVRNVGGDRRTKIVLSYAIGLAFALGLTLAGTSLKLGWMDSMILHF